ncbi:MAG: hypothetical protein JWN99_1054 [Ilumatobacteraceae bacterium]|nr:hypothetical protein [Ilumatobacteraceae bacterium]
MFAEDRAERQAVAVTAGVVGLHCEGATIFDVSVNGLETMLCDFVGRRWVVDPGWFRFSDPDDDRDLETIGIALAAALQPEIDAAIRFFRSL